MNYLKVQTNTVSSLSSFCHTREQLETCMSLGGSAPRPVLESLLRELDEAEKNEEMGSTGKKKYPRKTCKIAGCASQVQRFGVCYRHGGKKACLHHGCDKKNQGGGYCINHGGGKICKAEGCPKHSQGGGYCITHGGGGRCTFKGCLKKNQGRGYCVAHGGGKRCGVPNCPKGAQTGGFCVAHGGGRQRIKASNESPQAQGLMDLAVVATKCNPVTENPATAFISYYHGNSDSSIDEESSLV